MAADNWTICPRCLHNARTAADMERAEVMALYGKVPVEEFDAKRDALDTPQASDYATFREDYSFQGAAQGEISVRYKGGCSECGLRCEIDQEVPFYDPATGQEIHADTETPC